MVVVMEVNSTEQQVEAVIERMLDMGFNPSRTTGQSQTLIAGVGHGAVDLASFESMAGVREAHRISSPFKLASRLWKPEGTRVALGNAVVGGPDPVFVVRSSAGETAAGQVSSAAASSAHGVAATAAKLRFGYEGVPVETLRELSLAARAAGLFAVVEIMDPARIERLSEHADGFLAPAHQMENNALLRALGRQTKPVIVERSPSATIDDWLMAAEAILVGGNGNVVLCERGIKTFDAAALTMDISSIPTIKKLSHLPVIADPFRATGKRDRVLSMGRAALAAGADGLIIDAGEALAETLAEWQHLGSAMLAW
ncbi:MAG: 3-deoxy-7-phosphoheptulonate synthase [Bryobacteraceae bacterium]